MSEETQIQQEETNPPTQSYISRVRLKGYKSILDTEVTFKPGLNIIIGANGSGKTNFVEFLAKLLEREIIENLFTYSAEIQFKSFENGIIEYSLKYDLIQSRGIGGHVNRANRKEYIKVNDNTIEIKDELKAIQVFESFFLVPSYITFGIKEEFLALKNSLKLEIMMQDTYFYATKTEPKVTNGLRFLLLSLLLPAQIPNHFVSLEEVIEEMQIKLYSFKDYLKKFTTIKDVRISKGLESLSQGNHFSIDYIKLDFLINNNWLTWNQLSDGTKRMFYIITEITFANNIVLLEEPELGIHPHQLSKLMDFLKEQSEEKQIIITTHSPQVLNILDIDELDRIIVANYDKEKGTLLHHLSEEEMEHARSYMETEGLFLSDYWVYSGFEKEEEEV